MFKRLTKHIRQYFGFSQKEILGLYILIPLIILVLLLPTFYKSFLKKYYPQTVEIDLEKIEEWRKEIQQVEEENYPTAKKRYFNPNLIDYDNLVDLGFKKSVAKRIIHFRDKGGKFYKKKDLLKIYGIDSALVIDYFDYIILPQRVLKRNSYKKYEDTIRSKKPTKILLNQANEHSFQHIKGIGPYWAGRIIKYRAALGGFVKKEQLYEMYGVDKQLIDLVVSQTVLNGIEVQKINVNQDTLKNISKHPYISRRVGTAIIKYRNQHGDYNQIEELKNILTISDSLYQKISPYLDIR